MSDDPLIRLEADCAAQAVTVAAVLDDAGVAASTWWRWKQERFEPRAATLRRLRQSLEKLAAQQRVPVHGRAA